MGRWRTACETARDHGLVSRPRAAGPIRRYVIIESASVGLTVHKRRDAGQAWTVATLVAGDLLPLPDIGVEIPVAALYESVDFTPPAADA